MTPITTVLPKPPHKKWADTTEKYEAKDKALQTPVASGASSDVDRTPADRPSVDVNDMLGNGAPVTNYTCSHRPLTKPLILAGLMQALNTRDVKTIKFDQYTLKFKCKECEDRKDMPFVWFNVIFIGECYQTGRVELIHVRSSKATMREKTLDFTKILILDEEKIAARKLLQFAVSEDDDQPSARYTPPTLGIYMNKHAQNNVLGRLTHGNSGRVVKDTPKKKDAPVFSEDNFPADGEQ